MKTNKEYLMSKFTTLFEFGCEIFGYNKAKKCSNDYLKVYYNDWKTNHPKTTIKQYKILLNKRE